MSANPKITVEYEHGFLRIRHDGETWETTPDGSTYSAPCYFWAHRDRNGKWTREVLSTVELEKRILDLLTRRLKLSHFWNGQTDLFR